MWRFRHIVTALFWVRLGANLSWKTLPGPGFWVPGFPISAWNDHQLQRPTTPLDNLPWPRSHIRGCLWNSGPNSHANSHIAFGHLFGFAGIILAVSGLKRFYGNSPLRAYSCFTQSFFQEYRLVQNSDMTWFRMWRYVLIWKPRYADFYRQPHAAQQALCLAATHCSNALQHAVTQYGWWWLLLWSLLEK